MMIQDVTGTTPVATPSPTAPATSPASTNGTTTQADPLGKTAFLNLLVTQLQNQDPLQPQDNSEFLAQLAQFSSLEQLQQINSGVSTLTGDFSSVTGPVTTPVTPPDTTSAA